MGKAQPTLTSFFTTPKNKLVDPEPPAGPHGKKKKLDYFEKAGKEGDASTAKEKAEKGAPSSNSSKSSRQVVKGFRLIREVQVFPSPPIAC